MTDEQKQIVLDNQNLIHLIIQRHFSWINIGTPDYEDCVQRGYSALCRVVQYYDPEKGTFSTYACNAILKDIRRYLNTDGAIVTAYYEDGQFHHEPMDYLNRNVEDGEGGSTELLELIPNGSEPYLECEMMFDACNAYKKASKKYGLDILNLLIQGYTQKEIADKIGISQSFVQKLITKALYIYNGREYTPSALRKDIKK